MSNFLNKTFNKFVGQPTKSNANQQQQQQQHQQQQQYLSNQLQQDTQLTLTHLRKVFYEYLHPKTEFSQNDKDDKLYSILPLFIKVRFK
jgi:hypothetical protein